MSGVAVVLFQTLVFLDFLDFWEFWDFGICSAEGLSEGCIASRMKHFSLADACDTSCGRKSRSML